MNELALMKRDENAGGDEAAGDHIDRIRTAVDRVDEQIVALLGERVRLARSMDVVRRTRGEPAEDPARDAAEVRAAARSARKLDLDEEVVRRIYWRVVELAQVDRRA